MSPELQTIILSFITSLIVSLITFTLGLKSGKNQTDRTKLQNLYRDLYSHFSDLRNSLERNRPKSWEQYKKVQKGMYSEEYFPPVKELKRSGDILFLDKKLATQSLELEKQLMNYSHKLKCTIPEIHAVIISELEIFQDGYKFSSYHGDDKSHFKTANPNNCSSFIPMNYRDFINKQEIAKLFQKLDINKSTALEFTSGDNPISYSAMFYPGGIKIKADEYSDHLFSKIEKEVTGYSELRNQKDLLISKIDELNEKIARKAKEPVSFWGTLLGAFADMFR